VTGATIGIRLGAHQGGGSVVGLLVQNNTVFLNTSNGIQVTSGLSTEIAFNTVNNNGSNGISYSGNSSLIHDNVVHHNGQFGIYVKDGVDHVVYDNTAFGNTQSISRSGRNTSHPAVIYCGLSGRGRRSTATGQEPRDAMETQVRFRSQMLVTP
jgi:parallel beta-helix repeat protein